MAYKITDECIACGACAGQCPVEAITDAGDKYEINAETCLEQSGYLHQNPRAVLLANKSQRAMPSKRAAS